MLTAIILIALIILSGFFSSAEIALVSIPTLKIRQMINQKKKGAKTLLKIKEQEEKTLITILIGNNLVNIGASAVATKMAIDLWADAGVGIATGIMTLIILTFGEIIPKSIASKKAKNYGLKIAPILLFLNKALHPLVILFINMNKIIHRIIKADQEPIITEEEVRELVNIGEEEGQIKPSEKEMIQNIFMFDDITAGDIMTPRPEMFALDWNMNLLDALPEIIEQEYSRIPVYDKRLDKIKGIIITKEILNLVSKGDTLKKLKEITKPAYFVPETMKIDKLLTELKKRKTHMAIVMNEHGGVEGLVTIEDVLEEIVGEIFDETDEPEKLIRKTNKQEYKALGKTPITMINQKIGLKINEEADFNTIAGFLHEKLGRIPTEGDKVILSDNTEIIVNKTDGPVLLEVIIRKKNQKEKSNQQRTKREEEEQ